MTARTIVVLEGDQTGQELPLESLRVLAPEVTRVSTEFAHFDLSLDQRRATRNAALARRLVTGPARDSRAW